MLSTSVECQLGVCGHTCPTFGADSTQAGVSIKANQAGFARLLQSSDSCAPDAQICFES